MPLLLIAKMLTFMVMTMTKLFQLCIGCLKYIKHRLVENLLLFLKPATLLQKYLKWSIIMEKTFIIKVLFTQILKKSGL